MVGNPVTPNLPPRSLCLSASTFAITTSSLFPTNASASWS